jgi:hypothetical protein
MREFVPLYETLYDNEKLGMSHVARSVYGGLCLKARKDKGDRVRLPRGEQDVVQGVWRLVGGKPEEVQAALAELQDEKDPMVRVEGEPGRYAITLLAATRWALQGRVAPAGDDEQPAALDSRSSAARRQAAYRQRRNATRNADHNDPRNGGHNATRNALGGKGGSLVETSEKEEKKKEEVVGARNADDRNADRNSERNASVSASRPGIASALRAHPELVEYEQMGQLKLNDCAANLRRVADGFVTNGKLRQEAVRERLEWAISEVAREVRSANQTSGPLPAKAIAKKLETFAATNLGRPREQWEADRPLREGRPSRPGAPLPAPPPPKVAEPGSIARLAAAKRDE